MTTKAELSKALADSSAYCNKVIDGMTDQKGMGVIKFFTGDTPRLMVLDVQHRPQLRALREPGHLHAPGQDRAAVEREDGHELTEGWARGEGLGGHGWPSSCPEACVDAPTGLGPRAGRVGRARWLRPYLAGLRARLLAGRAALLREGARSR